MRNVANRKVRYYKGDLSDGRGYKKLFESWDIRDHFCVETKQDVMDGWYKEEAERFNGVLSWAWYKRNPQEPLQETINEWKKRYLCK